MGRRGHSDKIGSIAEVMSGARSSYNAATESRLRSRRMGLAPMGSGADFHFRSEADHLRVMEVARDMDRNDAVIGQALDRYATNVVQDGFTLDPQTGNDGGLAST